MTMARANVLSLLLLAAVPLRATAAPAAAAPSLDALVGKTVHNRDIYRLAPAAGKSFRIPALAPLKLARVEPGADGIPVPWFDVEGEGQARPSDDDVARIKERKAAGKLPSDWSWVYATDPRAQHPDWDEKFWKAIATRTIDHDMTPEMVRMAFGEPDKINVNKRPDSVQEMWVYSTGSVWFVDGKVFSWQAP